jgi:hypothetical protein
MPSPLSNRVSEPRRSPFEVSPMPVLVGSPRSGTTLLRFMLDSHSDLAIPPETGFLLLGKHLTGAGPNLREQFFQAITTYPPEAPGWSDFHIPAEEFRARLQELRPFSVADGFRLFYRMYADRFGKPRWGDKTPTYGHHLEYLQELLPEARFVHLVRDGRDAAVSLRRCWFSPGHDIGAQAGYWRDNVLAARQQGAACRHYLEVRYEVLLRNTESELRRICSFLELDYQAAMLSYHERTPQRLQEHLARRSTDGSVVVTQEERLRQQAATRLPPDLARIGAWRQALSAKECEYFEAIAGDLLNDLGYALTRAAVEPTRC